MNENYAELEERLGYCFADRALLREALTHPSYPAEHESCTFDNQRLEYLGDAVVQIAVTTRMYTEFPDYGEGPLTKLRATLTRMETLADFARHIQLGQHLRLGHGEEMSEGRDRTSNLCDAFEALIGAIYLDCENDIRPSMALINGMIDELHPDIEANLEDDNPKGGLQEWAQKELHEKPTYAIVDAVGPDHDKTFTVEVLICGNAYGQGTASRLRNAEQEAARVALARIRESEVETGDA